jgi:hypothetical protein
MQHCWLKSQRVALTRAAHPERAQPKQRQWLAAALADDERLQRSLNADHQSCSLGTRAAHAALSAASSSVAN